MHHPVGKNPRILAKTSEIVRFKTNKQDRHHGYKAKEEKTLENSEHKLQICSKFLPSN